MTPHALDLARTRMIADVDAMRRVAALYRSRGRRFDAHFWDEAAEVADVLAMLARRYAAPVVVVTVGQTVEGRAP